MTGAVPRSASNACGAAAIVSPTAATSARVLPKDAGYWVGGVPELPNGLLMVRVLALPRIVVGSLGSAVSSMAKVSLRGSLDVGVKPSSRN